MFRYLYIFFLALIVSLVATASLSYWYPYPKAPEYPQNYDQMSGYEGDSVGPSPAINNQVMEQKKYDEEMKAYNKKSASYTYNSNIAKMSVAVVFFVIAAFLFTKFPTLSQGLALGGVFVILSFTSSIIGFYGFDMNTGSGNTMTTVQLGALYICLFISILIGYIFLEKNPVRKKL